jgi:uncharacterized protein YybS (DUF2232 family)
MTTTNTSNSITMKFGLIGLAIFAIAQLVYWQVDLALFIGLTPTIVGILVFVLCIIGQVQTKKARGGFISYGDALKSFVISAALALIGKYVMLFLIFNVLDPEAATTIMKMTMEQAKESAAAVAEMFGVDGAEMDQAMEQMENNEDMMVNPYGGLSVVSGYFFSLLFFIIGGLISSAIIKKNPPQEWE